MSSPASGRITHLLSLQEYIINYSFLDLYLSNTNVTIRPIIPKSNPPIKVRLNGIFSVSEKTIKIIVKISPSIKNIKTLLFFIVVSFLIC